uniref:NB-ARC domain-containing protein n=1 Tax=Salix viminalis TaxID=40686 RepID=A0A6N2KCP0_SALVM
MADALLSVVLEQLGSLIDQKVEKEVRLVAGSRRVQSKDFQASKMCLRCRAKAVEGRTIKHVSYDMDDVLDEWSTAIAKSQMKVNDEHPRKTIKKALLKIQESIREEILLVLDDVWNEDSTNRFLVTTRKKVASMGSSSTDILERTALSDECWSLFNSRKSFAFQKKQAEWESVLNNHVWEIEEAENQLLAPLWLSYHDLPLNETVFLYWIFDQTVDGTGFPSGNTNQEMEVTGGECFEALAARSLFQDFEKHKDDGRIIECKMHDMVHDFAQSMTKNESFSVEIDGGPAESKIDTFSRDARHSMVCLEVMTDSFPATIHSFKKLRSLIVDALPNLIANLSCLRTLKLANCGIEEVPSTIGKLIHLRHVDLSRNKIKELPEEMCELYNMQTLDVSNCGELEKLPDNIGKLIKLRHLSVGQWDDSSFVEMRGVEGLGCLRELDEFHVSGSGEGSNIGGLKNLNHLQGYLRIKWLGDVKDPDEVKKAELKSKKNLTRLGLWFGSRTERGIIRDDEILEALEPPPNIDWLG